MYVKLFEQILDSSIAENYKVRLVFEDMLLLADKHGILDMTHEGFARRTNVPLRIVKAAIVELEKPDSKSRRKEQGGRRIVRLDEHRAWGWHLVNFEYYRELRNEENRTLYMRDYIKKWRASGKDKTRPVSTRRGKLVNSGKHLVNTGKLGKPMQTQMQIQTQIQNKNKIRKEKIARKDPASLKELRGAGNPSEPASRIKLCTDDWLNSLKPDCQKQGIDLDKEIINMKRWLSARPARKMTQRFVINWLNKCDKIVSGPGFPLLQASAEVRKSISPFMLTKRLEILEDDLGHARNVGNQDDIRKAAADIKETKARIKEATK